MDILKINELMPKAQQMFKHSLTKIKVHAPEILVGTGIVSGAAAIVFACRSTVKSVDIIEDGKQEIAIARKELDEAQSEVIELNGDIIDNSSEINECRKKLAKSYIILGGKLTKEFAPVVIFEGVSIACNISGFKQMKTRANSIAAAYGILNVCFTRYRNNVVNELGKEADERFRYGIKKVTTEDILVNGKGKEKKIKSTHTEVADICSADDFSRFFDSSCPEWTKNPEFNKMYLEARCAILNKRLKTEGYLFLNDVYEELGFERTSAGQVVGWIYDENNPIGDNFIDFGLYDSKSDATRRFVNGLEPVVLLKFNVDGVIIDKI